MGRVLTTKLRAGSRFARSSSASVAAEGSSSKTAAGGLGRRTIFSLVAGLLIIAVIVGLIVTASPSATTTTAVSSIYVSSGADIILTTAVRSNPAGFSLEYSKSAASTSSDWAILQQSDGSEANVTVISYSSSNASQDYFDRLVSGVSGLSGYSEITSDLSSFQQYGKCYGYGEDVDSIAVANGVCTVGNVFLQVHLVSGISFSDLEGDLTSLMGALYQSTS